MNDLFDLGASFDGGVMLRKAPRQLARLSVSAEGLRALDESGASHLLPWSDMRLDRGGSSGEVIFCSDHRGHLRIDCEAPGFLRALEGSGGNQLADELARLEGLRISSRWSHRALWLTILGLAIAAFWLAPRAFDSTIDTVVDSLPYSVDETIGESALGEMSVGGQPVHDELVLGALQEMVDRLSPQRSLEEAKFELRVIESETVNAFALPGGYLTVFTGLLRQAERPEQVAGVLAHEMAHVTLRHGLSRVAHSVGIFVGMQLMFGDVDGLMAVATELFSMATVNSYSREQEAQADAEGVRMMIEAGIDPNGLIEFFQYLERETDSLPGALSWMSTHPEHEQRIAAIRKMLSGRRLPATEPLSCDWEAVRARLEP